jgi:hypothetical protein
LAGETLHFLNQRGNIIKYHNGLQLAVNYILKGQYQEWIAKVGFYFLMGFWDGFVVILVTGICSLFGIVVSLTCAAYLC